MMKVEESSADAEKENRQINNFGPGEIEKCTDICSSNITVVRFGILLKLNKLY